MADDSTKPKWNRLPPELPVQCPYCGKRVALVPSDGDVAYYECETDGLLILPPDGRLRRQEPSR
ncbi:MAG TPA: hypothetical protein VF447_12670 [Terriglobales bacterium]